MKIIDLRRLWMGEFKSFLGAILIAIIATCMLILSSAVLELIIPGRTSVSQFIAYIIYDLIVAFGCYFLCMKNPYSFWFVPVLCNVTGIVLVIIEINFWISSIWIFVVFGWMISFVSSIWGHDVGLETRKSQMKS